MVVVMVMAVVMMMVMVVMMLGHWGRGGGGRSGFLRHGVAGEAQRENGRGREGLDHGTVFLWLGEPQRVEAEDKAVRLNSK
jgi:hypothetical protein